MTLVTTENLREELRFFAEEARGGSGRELYLPPPSMLRKSRKQTNENNKERTQDTYSEGIDRGQP